MAIDPQKMAAFASGPKPGSDDLDAAAAQPAPEVEKKDEDMLEGGPGRFGKLIPLLEANAEELEACCDELDPDALMNTGADLPEDDRDILLENVVSLPDDLIDEMMNTVGGITKEEAEKLAAHLEDESMIEDGDLLAAMLVHVGKLIDSGDLSASEEEEDEYEDEEGDSEEGDQPEDTEEEDEEYEDEEEGY